ncbi:MAG: glycerate dehydrogenase [Burkholderiales bacterium]|nr:glycerate dehydrogenase [Burkholderiales bacterium]
MSNDVICLRPLADFTRIGVHPPASLTIQYLRPDDPQLSARIARSSALVIPAVGPKLAGSLFEGSQLALVQVTGAGVDRLDEAALKRLRIPVANIPGGSNAAVAEYVVSAASNLLRRLAWADAEIKAGRYVEFRARMIADNLAGLEGLRVGIVGLGTIGLAVAQAFRAYGCTLAYHDPAPKEVRAAHALGMTAMDLDELLATSDVVTLHVPLLPSTKNLVGARELARMKPGAILVNAARGGIVDEAALVAALASGHLGGAAVDVYSTEPPGPDNALLAANGEAAHRLLLTPHIAGVSLQAWQLLFRSAWDNVERVVVRGEPAHHRVY